MKYKLRINQPTIYVSFRNGFQKVVSKDKKNNIVSTQFKEVENKFEENGYVVIN